MMSVLRFFVLVGFASSVVAGVVAGSAIAQSDPLSPAQTPALPAAPTPLVAPDDTVETVQYSDQAMSVDYPASWQVEVIDNGIMISSVPETDADLVATQIVRIAAPPGPVVDANIDSFIGEGTAVSRYRTVDIDGQSALVMWLAERPGDLSRAIATFIGYGDETVLLFSRYAPENPMAEADILRLHSSFTKLAATEDVPDGAVIP